MTDAAQVIEAMLLRWTDSHTGRTVTLQLPDDGDHPFKGLKCGPANGQRLAVSVALIADDETQAPVEPKPAGKSYAQRAALLCQEGAFITFVRETQNGGVAVSTADKAVDWLRDECGVYSRKQIIEGTPAGRRFLDLVAEYEAWKRL